MNGFLNCHARGVHSIVLGKKNGRLRRVFIAEKNHTLWRNTPTGDALSVGFHPHHCNLKIKVLSGQIVNLSLTSGSARSLATYRYQSAIHGGTPEFLYVLPAAPYGIEELSIVEGGELELPAEVFHTVWVAEGESAVWLIEEGEADPYYLPIALSDDDLNVFDWTGMYQPMSEAACCEMLRRYAPDLVPMFPTISLDAWLRAESSVQKTPKEPDALLSAETRARVAEQRVEHLQQDVNSYDSRVIALMSSEDRLRKESDVLRRRLADVLDRLVISIDGGDVFEGTAKQFEDCFFVNSDLGNIESWAAQNGWSVEFKITAKETA